MSTYERSGKPINVLYIGPDDDRFNPPRSFLEDLFLATPADHWSSGGGDSALYIGFPDQVYGDEETMGYEGEVDVFYFFFDEPHGFYIEARPASENAGYCPYNREHDEGFVEHRIGGEAIVVSKAHYLNRHDALRAMWSFLTDGALDPLFEWVQDGFV